jgi:polyferredoxin
MTLRDLAGKLWVGMNGLKLPRRLRLTNVRVFSQVLFFTLFVLAVWATWTTRLGGYPVSRFLEADPLVMISTALATGYVYRFLGWGLIILAVTLLFGRVFCNWMCPYGTLHQFIAWIFNIRKHPDRWKSNQYRPIYFLKYGILIVFLIMASMGALQIGLLDPICLMYRSVTAALAPASDMLVSFTGHHLSRVGIDAVLLETLKFAPGVERRVFVGSFWIGLVLVGFVGMNLVIPRFFCRVVCPLGALLGVFSRFALFRINRDVHKCTDCNLCLTRCEGASDPQAQLRLSECFSCMNCIDDCPEDALSFTMVRQDAKQVIPGTSMGRRKAVFSAIAGVIALPFLKNNGVNTDMNYSRDLIRPPGSVEENDFLKKCIKCDQCINAAPPTFSSRRPSRRRVSRGCGRRS